MSKKSSQGPTISQSAVRGQDYLRVEPIETWSAYLEFVRSSPYRNWAFRGHADTTWPLKTTVARQLERRRVHPSHWESQEQRIIHIFQRKALAYLDHPPSVGDVLQWLAIMQHHGAPTRLLDFTWSPYVAAFFALESSSSDAAVWAVNAPSIKSFCAHPYGYDEQRVPYPGKAFANYRQNAADPIAIGEPFFKPRRLIAQSGTFVYPADILQPVDESLRSTPDRIVKIVLRGSGMRSEAMAELYSMNITHATLFPDLDGLARSVAYELEQHWAYDPTTGDETRDEMAGI